MPYRLRKAPKRELYWVVGEDGKKHSKDPLPKERAMAQMRALYAAEKRGGQGDGPVASVPPPPPPPPKKELEKEHYQKDVPKKRPTAKEIAAMMALGRSMGLTDAETRVRMGLAPPPLALPPRETLMFDDDDTEELRRRGYEILDDDDEDEIPMPPPLPPRNRGRPASFDEMVEALSPEEQAALAAQMPPAFDRTTGRGKTMTHKQSVLKKLGLEDTGHTIAELAKASGVPRKTLQEVYNRGIGAYKTNPTSVRMKGSYVKGKVAPMSKKLSKEQWAAARVYSFLDGNPKHDQDLRGAGPMPPRTELQPIASASYNPPPPPTIGNLKLLYGTGTLVFYFGEPNTIVVGIRGTVPSDTGDLKADASIVVGQLRSSQRFKQDLAALQQFQLKYPPSQYDYYGVGHSLGGAILDEFLKMKLLKRGVSYNPAVQPQTLFSKTDNERVYEKGDPLYQLIGRFTNPEVRDTQSKKPKSILSKLPYLGKAYDYLQSHGLANFSGGAKAHGEFADQLHEVGIDPASYLRIARDRAKDAGLPYKLLGFADDDVHKLAIPDGDGKMVKFGAVGYGDFILWSDAEARGEVPKGYAEQKRRTFQKSHRAMKGDWKKNPFSPNSLALKVLW